MTKDELNKVLASLPFLDRDELDKAHRELHRYLFGQRPNLLNVDEAVIAIDDLAAEEKEIRQRWLRARINGESESVVHALELEMDKLYFL